MGMLDEIKARQAAKAQENMATGTASSVDTLAAKVEKALEKNPELVEEVTAPVEVPEGAYGAKRLRQFYLADGTKVSPVDGGYIPQSEEEEQMLEYYASKGVVDAPAAE